MRPAGAATPKIVVYLVFALLIAAIATFVTIGYRTYQRDMYLPQSPVTIAMHDPAALQPTVYAMKEPGDPTEKGEIIDLVPTSAPTMSGTEMTVWIISAVMLLGVLAGIAMAFKHLWNIGRVVTGGCAIVLVAMVCAGWYMATHRVTPYDVTIKSDVKPGAKPKTVTFSTNDSTTFRINAKDETVLSLRKGMKIVATLTQEGDSALKIVSPIPEDKPKNPAKDPKKGEILSVTVAPMDRATASFSEKVAWIIAVGAVAVVLAGVVVVVKKRWKTGTAIAVVGGIVLALCLWKAAYLKAHRMPPSDIVMKPDRKGDTKAQPITFVTDSSTTVKIDGQETDVKALTPDLKVQATLSDDNKTAISIISPIPEKRRAMLRLPEGFRGSAKRDDPRYLSSVELKEQYLFQCFYVQRGAQVIQVAQVTRDPLTFTAFARSIRLSALHDFKHSSILEEGPTFIPGARPATWERGDDSPFNRPGVNAFTLIVEGDDENGLHVRSRQILIRGEGTTVYVIKATAPVSEWPKAGEIFDSMISTFELADVAAAASTVPASEPATAAAATSPATIPVEMH